VIACVVVALALAIAATALLPRTYESNAKLIVGNAIGANTPDYNAQLLAQQLAQTYSQIALTVPVMQNVITRLSLPLTVEQLQERVSADAPTNLNIVSVNARAGDPQTAAAIAAAVSDELTKAAAAVGGRSPSVQAFVDRQLEATQSQIEETAAAIKNLQAIQGRTADQDRQLADLQSQLVNLNSSYASLLGYASGTVANKLTIIQPAPVPEQPASPKPVLNIVVGALVGLLLGIGLAFLLSHLDDKLRSPEQVSQLLRLPTLGSIGRMPTAKDRRALYGLVTAVYPRSSAAEAFRMLRTSLEFTAIDHELRTLAVVSPASNEGKTLIAANLAVAFAQSGRKTLLVDADLRKPTAHELFDLRNEIGLSSVLASSTPLAMAFQQTIEPNLVLMTAGPTPPNPAEMLASQRMKALVAQLAERTELVIFDTAPLGAVTDAAVLSADVGATLLVVDPNRTTRTAALDAVRTLARVGARVSGVVLNRVGSASLTAYGYYGDEDGRRSERAGRFGRGAKPAVQPSPAPTSVGAEAVAGVVAPARGRPGD